MSEETPAPRPMRPPPPHAWSHIAIAFSLFVLAAAACGGLVVQFMRSRPMDLRGHTALLADNLEDLLVLNRVPREQIQRSPAADGRDDGALWWSFEFDVRVPESISVVGLEKVVASNMPLQDVSVSVEPGHTIRLALGRREFAVVRLAGRPERVDRSAACAGVADQVVRILETCTPPPSSIDRSPAEAFENADTAWTLTRIRAVAPSGLEPDAVRAALEAAVAGQGVDLRTGPSATPSESTFTLSLSGLDCVELVLVGAVAELPAIELPVVPVRPAKTPADGDAALPAYDDLPLNSVDLDDSGAAPAASGAKAAGDAGPRIAIIVDDGGYPGESTEAILGLDTGLTLSILPNCDETTSTAQRAAEKGFEVMLHMPMETNSKSAKFPGSIKIAMTKDEIRALTEKALAQVPGAVGVNNHTGSKFTADEKSMRAFLELVKERGLYFVDSRTTAETVAYTLAQELGVPSAERDVFLDNEADVGKIRTQLTELVDTAKEQGAAIGICHFRPKTAQALAEFLPTLEESGVTLVHASELVH
ncbi:MAG: divergent polysaccharide deacetylase family protein [Candidatus Hydrogenedentes bacterium]|nr:divergent polysaccharide deacetylase family protein [Candidatus Hydrogenedentota bacterium]